MKLRWDESVKIGWKCFGWKFHWMKVSLDEIVFGWKCFLPFLWMDQWSKTTSHQKTGFGCSTTLRTSSWFQACQRVRPPNFIIQFQGHLQSERNIVLHSLQARVRLRQQHQVTMRLEKERIELKVIPFHSLCQVSMLIIERGKQLSVVNPITNQFRKPTKNFQKQIKRKPR